MSRENTDKSMLDAGAFSNANVQYRHPGVRSSTFWNTAPDAAAPSARVADDGLAGSVRKEAECRLAFVIGV